MTATPTTPGYAAPVLREESIWAAQHPEIAKKLPYAAPCISEEDRYIATQRTAAAKGAPVAKP